MGDGGTLLFSVYGMVYRPLDKTFKNINRTSMDGSSVEKVPSPGTSFLLMEQILVASVKTVATLYFSGNVLKYWNDEEDYNPT